MKLSKKQEVEVKKEYKRYFDSYIKGDVATIESLLDDDYNQIGSAESEVFFNKQDALKFLHDTIDQVAGKTEMRNRTIKIDPMKDSVLVTDLFDIYVLVEEDWTFYSKFRASTLMQEIDGQWKFAHQHSSVPDLKAQEGENIAIEKVSKENLELRNAIKRRTVELEHKNWELEIEAAMERVRAKAMAMHSTKDISDATAIVFNELTGLGVDMERCGIAIIHDKSSQVEIWSTPMSPKDKKVKEVITGYVDSDFHPMVQSIFEAWKNNESYFTYTLQGKEVKDYYEKLGKFPGYQFPKIAKYPDRQMAHCFYFEHGNIFVYSEEDLSEEQKQLLHRFTKVFSLTYKRYLDLKNAEDQVREAQIETALERVRSKTMAMHNSQDVGDTVATLFNEVLKLGLDKSIRCGIGILEGNEGMETWSATSYPDGSVDLKMGMLDMTIHPMLIGLKKAWKRGNPDYRYDYIGDDVLKYYKALNNEPEYPFQIDLNSLPENEYHRSFFYSEGILFAFAPNPISEEAARVLNRFAGVFGQTYRRYLDLKNAEAQAREALIEVSLERVRVRAMAMHVSSELSEVISTVFSELTKLDIRLTRTMLWIFDENPDELEVWMANSEVDKTPGSLRMAVTYPYHKKIFNAWKKRKAKWVYVLKGEEKKQLDDFLFKNTIAAQLPESVKDGIRAPEKIINSFSFHNFGGMQADGLEELSEENLDILYRFSKEFDLTYTRFQDLQKAEAQARESQIEAALERVRSRSIGMRKSIELREVIQVIHDQLIQLDFKIDAAGFTLDYHQNNDWNVWIANKSGSLPSLMYIPYIDHPQFNYYKYAKENGLDFLANILSFEEKNSIFSYMFGFMGDYPETEKEELLSKPGLAISQAFLKNISLWIYNLDAIPYSEEDNSILMRFANVFEQTYTRFVDLKKAEEQAREAQIEAALERVRSRTMGMQRSEELTDVASILFQQVKGLGVPQWACGFSIWEIGDKEFTWYAGSPDGTIMSPCKIPLTEHPVFMSFDESRKRGDELFIYEKEGEKQESHYQYMSTLPGGLGDQLQNMVKSGFTFPTFQIDHLANFSHGNLVFITYEHFPEMHDVFKRFAKVFEQTYTRFLDLQKAESQAREAQIEVALERVRSRTMAMHESDELAEIAQVLFDEIQGLGIKTWTCGFNIFNLNTPFSIAWVSILGEVRPPFQIPHTVDPSLKNIYNAWKAGESFYLEEIEGKDLQDHNDYMFSIADRDETVKLLLEQGIELPPLPTRQVFNCAYFKHGYLIFNTTESYPFTKDIFQRFAKVFEQTYTRFLDLQKAEAQTKEAQIEAALERVRSRTMGMQHSGELIEAANILFRQVRDMGVNLWSAGYGTWQKDKKATTLWMSSEDVIQQPFIYPHTEDPVSIRFSEAGEKGESLYVEEMGGEALKSHYEYMVKLPMVGEMLDDILKAGFDVPTFQVFHVAYFSYGYLLFITYEPCPETHNIFKRFAKVFEQTYTRFLDLQKTEAQAMEAVKQSSLDRIRAEIASMRTTNDLNRITPLIWRELTTLDVPFFRCGVFIVDDDAKNINVFLSNPSGDSLAAWNTEYESIPLFKATVDHWKKQLVYRDEWNRKQFIQFTKSLIDHGLIDNPDNFQAGKDAPEYLALQMIPFEQGMLYVGSSEKLDKEQIELVQTLADSFSVAYARYEDFKNLEDAKGRVENTLSDLKSAQNQLIQSEKMASLGELTAGIAHEIQNPLNFVNNFSEVNAELVEELREEVKKGNMEEVAAIASDIEENEKKIKHHGKRAEGIVKGMLQHSRTSQGENEPTDINALADEYLRLAYHGLRAKDKSFNADFKTRLDPSIPKIEVVPQDIGRILLNLINNAFYACTEHSRRAGKNYKPMVEVSTKSLGEKIQIIVKDNGPGIPEEIKDKIFQPFFTTKPTGKGTGLGLSLSYDIIKAHGGELKVETKENEGSEFIIVLGINTN